MLKILPPSKLKQSKAEGGDDTESAGVPTANTLSATDFYLKARVKVNVATLASESVSNVQQDEFHNMLKGHNPPRILDDVSEGQKSNSTHVQKEMKTVYCKQQEIADKQDLILSLLKRVTQEVPNLKVQLELALVENIIKENKTGLNQIEGFFDLHAMPSISDHPPACSDFNPVSPVEGNSYELGEDSHGDALQQAEQAIKHQRQQLALRESTASGDAQLMPSSGNIIQHEEHKVTSMSIVVGKENTTVNNSTVNILQIGEKAVDVDSPHFFEILKSLPLALQPSGKEEPALKRKEKLPSSDGTAEIARKRNREDFRSTLPSQEEQYATSVVHSHTVFQFLANSLTGEWKDVGRLLGLRESTLHVIKMDNSHNTQEAIYQMLLHWKQQNGSKATYNNLIRALLYASRKDLADEMLMREDLMEDM